MYIDLSYIIIQRDVCGIYVNDKKKGSLKTVMFNNFAITSNTNNHFQLWNIKQKHMKLDIQALAGDWCIALFVEEVEVYGENHTLSISH